MGQKSFRRNSPHQLGRRQAAAKGSTSCTPRPAPKYKAGKMERADGFTAARRQPPRCSPETGTCQSSPLTPGAAPEPGHSGRPGQGTATALGQEGHPAGFRPEGRAFSSRRTGGTARISSRWNARLGADPPVETPSFISSAHLQDPKEMKKQRGWAVCCLVAQGHRQKGAEGAGLFKAASSSIPRGGILPLECWLLCRRDLKSTYPKMIIKT